MKAEFQLGQNLAEFQQILTSQKANKPEEPEAADTFSPVYDPQIQLNKEIFLTQLHAYVKHLQSQNRMNQAVVLTEAVHELDANKWHCAVHSDLQEKLIAQDKDLLPFLRDKLGVPQLFLELSFAEASHTQAEAQPYTPEEKLKAMAEKNPTLKKLMELFNARIIYK